MSPVQDINPPHSPTPPVPSTSPLPSPPALQSPEPYLHPKPHPVIPFPSERYGRRALLHLPLAQLPRPILPEARRGCGRGLRLPPLQAAAARCVGAGEAGVRARGRRGVVRVRDRGRGAGGGSRGVLRGPQAVRREPAVQRRQRAARRALRAGRLRRDGRGIHELTTVPPPVSM